MLSPGGTYATMEWRAALNAAEATHPQLWTAAADLLDNLPEACAPTGATWLRVALARRGRGRAARPAAARDRRRPVVRLARAPRARAQLRRRLQQERPRQPRPGREGGRCGSARGCLDGRPLGPAHAGRRRRAAARRHARPGHAARARARPRPSRRPPPGRRVRRPPPRAPWVCEEAASSAAARVDLQRVRATRRSRPTAGAARGRARRARSARARAPRKALARSPPLRRCRRARPLRRPRRRVRHAPARLGRRRHARARARRARPRD